MASPCAIFATRLSPRAVYFIQTGGSALSNTGCMSKLDKWIDERQSCNSAG